MSIEADSQEDLALNTEDAENVVGGKTIKKKQKKATKKPAAHKAAGKSLPMVNIQTKTTETESSYVDDCDAPAVAVDSAGSEAG